ncbi:M10 family metallopeptidase C-terminal domain-containing protein, partial [Anabaena sp. PCC 7938]
NVNTGAGNDSIIGTVGNNVINTGAGNDTINGGDGNDTINGGAGNDTLIGGLGTDTITDGTGNDIYKYFATAESQVGVTRDIFTDFTSGVDKIDFSSIDADILLAGNQAFTFIGSAAFNGSGPQVRFSTSGGNLFLQAEINGDGNFTADMEIQLTGLTTILASDIIL